MSIFSALDRQRHLFLSGISGARPVVPIDQQVLAQAAQKKMSRTAWAYVAGGAGHELTLADNRTAFQRWQIVPRMLQDVSQASTATSLLGQSLPVPLLLAPVGVLDLAHPEADLAVGRAAAELGVPFIFSNQASVPMETVAAGMGQQPRWFQLYWSRARDLVASLVQRAEACGCSAIVVTLDTTMLGWRPRDLDLAYLPFLRGRGIAQYTSDPVFRRLMDAAPTEPEASTPPRRLTLNTLRSVATLMHHYPDTWWRNLRSGEPLRAVRTFTRLYTNPALQWSDLPFLREHTRLPILLKGILHPDDARRAVDSGVDGLIISNHGGRQVDGAVSSISQVPIIAAAVGAQLPLILDSGVRTGADMYKAIALGATAVSVGRPYVYGLALAGQLGVSEVIRNLWADFELTMRLSGCRSVAEIRSAGVIDRMAQAYTQ